MPDDPVYLTSPGGELLGVADSTQIDADATRMMNEFAAAAVGGDTAMVTIVATKWRQRHEVEYLATVALQALAYMSVGMVEPLLRQGRGGGR